ncbi:hypothetical protein CYMTET_33588 [Cymbomonas tetramitiformis]|uniref:UDENN domain-containing protein n=1 Tax=Cymbomonas tetramitiformis TaxID=36881 RepID=A0AAE0FCR5_9CHLO|nr:hypothetical protein CYMTET_33588 [Cymbomonas tetramitiformis]
MAPAHHSVSGGPTPSMRMSALFLHGDVASFGWPASHRLVLSLIPMLRPFMWQSLMLPALPSTMLSFLDAPVPFVVGVPHKSAEVRMQCAKLCRINVYKDAVKMVSSPPLPRRSELAATLKPLYDRVRATEASRRVHPLQDVTQEQQQAVHNLLEALQGYLLSLCSRQREHAITEVQNNDKVSILLKDSFVESFPKAERPFMRIFVETQMFTVYSDDVLHNPA